jgi:hypothetical protein
VKECAGVSGEHATNGPRIALAWRMVNTIVKDNERVSVMRSPSCIHTTGAVVHHERSEFVPTHRSPDA